MESSEKKIRLRPRGEDRVVAVSGSAVLRDDEAAEFAQMVRAQVVGHIARGGEVGELGVQGLEMLVSVRRCRNCTSFRRETGLSGVCGLDRKRVDSDDVCPAHRFRFPLVHFFSEEEEVSNGG